MKRCPYCAEDISEEATRCPYCRSDLSVPPPGMWQSGAANPPLPNPVPLQPAAGGAPWQPAPVATVAPPAPGPRVGEGALRFSHSGERYILGYGPDFFGIWDRTVAGGPVLRYPRNDEGWTEAWNRYSAMEPRCMEVPQSGGVAPDLRAPTGRFRSAHALAQWLVGLLAIDLLLTVLTFGFRVRYVSLLQAYQRGTGSVANVNTSRDGLNSVVGFGLLFLLATAVVWLVWQHRAHSNLRSLGASGIRFEPAWAVGWWFIPAANVVFPYLTMRELMKASDPAAGAVDWQARPTPLLLAVWWGSWLARVPFSVLAAVAAPGSEPHTVPQLLHAQYFAVGIDIVTIVAAIAAILVVREVDRRQASKQTRVSQYRSTLTTWS